MKFKGYKNIKQARALCRHVLGTKQVYRYLCAWTAALVRAFGGCCDTSDALVGSWHPSPITRINIDTAACALPHFNSPRTVPPPSDRNLAAVCCRDSEFSSALSVMSHSLPCPSWLSPVGPRNIACIGISLAFCFLLPCPETGSTTKPARTFHLSSPFPHMRLPSRNPLL